jgi:NADPH-dependent curcumin reductase CurA
MKYYSPALHPGDAFTARGIASVLRSRHPSYTPGDVVVGMLPIQEYIALAEDRLGSIGPLENPLGIPDLRDFLGALGVPGLTAYIGLYEIGRPTAGQTILVSAASGAVGQLVGQLARLEGMRTIGSVGSDEKLAYIMGELGFDAGFNYRSESPSAALARLAPDGIDVYYDNVGGTHLEAALEYMRDFGRVVMCGTISDYNHELGDQGGPSVRGFGHVFSRRLTMKGFIVSDKGCVDRQAAELHQERMQRWLKDGTIKTKKWEVQGIENAPEAFLALFSGGNFGKAVLRY